MTQNIYNFSAGPAMIAGPVLERAKEEMLSFGGLGVSVMEISHRSKEFAKVLEGAEQGLRELLDVPQSFRVLFLQGGATMQFSMVPMSFLAPDTSADYLITGAWGRKAADAARLCGNVNELSAEASDGLLAIPELGEVRFDKSARYLHYTSNETIDGVEFGYDVDGGSTPVVCDASSDILSRTIDFEKYALIYAGAQKNIGPSGVTLVIIRDDMIERVPDGLHPPLDYRQIAANRSMLNTPNTWGVYMIGLVCDWLRGEGGVEAIARRNREKASLLYAAIDSSDGFYRGFAAPSSRSLMNVTFGLPSSELDVRFVAEAEAAGLIGLKGHRSVGGIRASIYNAFPLQGVEVLVDLMRDFARRNG